MFTSTIILSGNVVVQGVSFSWWVRDGAEPLMTVSHHKYGTDTEPLGELEPLVQARTMANQMLARRLRKRQAARDALRGDQGSKPE